MPRHSSRHRAVRRRKLKVRPGHNFVIKRDRSGHYRVFLSVDRSLFYRNKKELLADEPVMHLLGQGTLYQFERRQKA